MDFLYFLGYILAAMLIALLAYGILAAIASRNTGLKFLKVVGITIIAATFLGPIVYFAVFIITITYEYLGWIGAVATGVPIAGFFIIVAYGITRDRLKERRLRQEAILKAKIDSMVEAKLEALKDDTEGI